MRDCEKLYLIMYVNVSGMNRTDVPYFLHNVAELLDYDDTVNRIVIPIEERDSYIELLNGDITDEENKKRLADAYTAMNAAIEKYGDKDNGKEEV